MFKLAALFGLLQAIAVSVASPVSDEALAKRAGTNYSGTAKQYTPSPLIPGSCDDLNSATDAVVGISSAIYGTGGNCGNTITITNTDNSIATVATVVNKCATCSNGDIEVTQEVATVLNNGLTPGPWATFEVQWSFN